MHATMVSIGVVVALTGTAFAQQEIRVRVWCGANYQQYHYDAGDPIDIDVTAVGGCPDHINIWDRTGSPTHDIGPVYLYGSRSTDITVTISSGAWRGLDDDPHVTAGGNWAGITASPGVEEHVLLEGHVSGNLAGLISVGEVYRLDIDGQVQSGIQANTAGLGPFWLYAGSIGANGNATSIADSIARIETRTGDMSGAVSAGTDIGDIIVAGDLLASSYNPDIEAGGNITLLQASGDIGEPGDPVVVEAVGAIKFINIPSGDLYADISATKLERTYGVPHDQCVYVGGNVSETTITLTDSIRDHFTITGGHFALSSEIHVKHLADGAELKVKKDGNGVGGSMLGNMYFSGVLGAQSLIEIDRKLDGLLSFNGDGTSSLNDDIYILGDLGAGEGLTGQVILNADASANEAWGAGLVKFGADNDPEQFWLSPVPYYTNTSASIGGGAVGLAPFNYHPIDSEPDDDSTVLDPDSISTATVWYYGPVFVSGTGSGPYAIESRILKPPSQTWTDVSSSYTVTVVGGTSRQVEVTKISGQFPVNREYRFVPYQSGSVKKLVCSEVTGNPPVHDTSADDHYSFSIPLGTLDSLDFSGDGKLDDADMAAWLSNESDLDKDGKIDEDDYLALLDVIENGL